MSQFDQFRKIPSVGEWSREDAGESGITCPVCGADSGYVHTCVECRKLDPGDHDDADHDLADARDKPERFLDVDLLAPTPKGGMKPKKKLQQRIRGLRTVAQVERYLQVELTLDREECPRQGVVALLNQRKDELEADDQADAPTPDAGRTSAVATDGGTDTGVETEGSDR
jgi:hypothetical protein